MGFWVDTGLEQARWERRAERALFVSTLVKWSVWETGDLASSDSLFCTEYEYGGSQGFLNEAKQKTETLFNPAML